MSSIHLKRTLYNRSIAGINARFSNQTVRGLCGMITLTQCQRKCSCFLGIICESLTVSDKVINVAWYLLWQLLCILFNHHHHGSQRLFFPLFISFLPLFIWDNYTANKWINFQALYFSSHFSCLRSVYIFSYFSKRNFGERRSKRSLQLYEF